MVAIAIISMLCASAGAARADDGTPPVLTAGQPHRVRVEAESGARFRLQPDRPFVEVTVTFDGAEVVSTLLSGETRLVTARTQERTRGRMTLSTDVVPPTSSTSPSSSSSPLILTIDVLRDYARPADVTIEWTWRQPSAADRELSALQREVYTSIGEWWDGTAGARKQAHARLTACLDRIRAAGSQPLLFEALYTFGEIDLELGGRDRALAALDEAATIARVLGDAQREALAILRASVVRGTTGELGPSVELTKTALTIFERIGDVRGQADALQVLAGHQANRGSNADALKSLDRAEPLAEASGDRRTLSGVHNVRGVIYGSTGRPTDALEAYGRALALRRTIGDRAGTGQTLSNLGVVWRDSGDVRRAIALQEEALALRRAAGFQQGIANTAYNLGNSYLDLGEFQRAIDLLTESLTIYRETRGLRGEAFALQNLGQVAVRLGDPVKAKANYEQALALWQKVGDRRGEAIVLTHLAGLAIARNTPAAYDEAAALLDRSLASSRAAHARREEADALIALGWMLRKRGDHTASMARLREAVAIDDEIKNGIGGANARMELGLTLDAAGQADEARTEIQASLASRQARGERRGQVIALAGLARLDRQAGALAEAQANAFRALDLLDQLRTGVISSRTRLTMGVSAQSVYELARDILIDRHLIEPAAGHDRAALAVHERARARSLLEALAAERLPAPNEGAAVQALVDRQRELEGDLEVKTARLGRLSDAGQPTPRIAEARDELSRLVLTLDEVKAEIRKQSPSFAALTQPKTLTDDSLRALLDADTVLIEIALGEKRSVGWLVSTTGVRTVILPARAAIEEAARDLVAALTARNRFIDGESRTARQARLAKDERRWIQAAARVTSLVLSPFGAFRARRVAFVTDGALAGVPFVALPVTSTNGTLHPERPCVSGSAIAATATRGGAATASAASAAVARPASAACALGRHAEVVALPSASVLAELRRSRASRPSRTLRAAVLADPVFRADDPRVNPGTNGDTPAPTADASPNAAAAAREVTGVTMREALQSLETLPRLPFSREEARTIETLAGSERVVVGLDFDASRATLARAELAAPDVLHIATHAIVDENQPELSGIVLSLVDAQGQRVRGFLPLVEVYDLPVHADLVVLSACRTAAGPDVPGEGLASLTRGFMYAGTPRVIASLWSVEDRATAAFMRAFYQALFVRRLSAAAALRAAQAELRQSPRWSSPYYWAAFTLQGDWQ